MQIHGTTHASGPHALQGLQRTSSASRPAETSGPSAQGPVDKLDISPAAQAASQATDTGIRSDLVNRLRQEIAGGTYETPAKIDAALERLLNELG